MESITATEAKQHFAVLLEKAQRQPVMITKQSRDVAVVMSREQYERMRKLDIEEFQQFRTKIARKAKERGLTPEILEQLLNEE